MKFTVLLATAFALLPLAPAAAWEYAFGPDTTADQGLRRVAPVTACPGWPPGYVAVGTKDQFGADPDVYVVFTDLTGWPVWEMTYDVLDHGFVDEGVAILELANRGFVFLSNVHKAGVQWLPALTFIRCDGTFARTAIYPDALTSLDLFGRDLILTRTGDPGQGTAPGDFAIAGVWWNGATRDGFLMRTDGGGGLIWNLAYDSAAEEAFLGLTEAAPLTGQVTGDLVAVGSYEIGGNLDGLVARVSGDDGTFALVQHCLAHHGDLAQDEYRAVTELSSPGFAGEFAMAGKTSLPPGWSDDVWVTRGTPCMRLWQSRIGDAAGTVRDEEAFDLREVLDGTSGAPAGSLAIAGAAGPLGGPSDAALLFVDQATLMPIYAEVFGGPQAEVFYSLAENPLGGAHPPGFILAGKTETDWAAVLDPRDLYLVYEHVDLVTCRSPWVPDAFTLTWNDPPLAHTEQKPARGMPEKTSETGWFTPVLICP